MKLQNRTKENEHRQNHPWRGHDADTLQYMATDKAHKVGPAIER